MNAAKLGQIHHTGIAIASTRQRSTANLLFFWKVISWTQHCTPTSSLAPICLPACVKEPQLSKRISWFLLWKVERGTKWQQAAIRYFHNPLIVPWGIQLWAHWDFCHLSTSQISQTCEESSGLWFNCAPNTEKLEGFQANSPGARSTEVLFIRRASTYLSTP